ncbi:site-2 protease family protein [Murdochiella massiliensis]|uniref:site-2 protease family protein n=1 Tax=Murdochiella massiliensis TaxID=1673723 RepID=UPI0011DD5EBF|nr:site-2 protease family protein [Murdochiella massiliensis]
MQTITSVIAITYTIISHECAHGLVAYWNGDSTAKEAGRITLNPLPHIDPIGLISLFVFRFGWAKPVPINPNRFHHERLGMLSTSLAGVTVNFLSAVLAAIFLPRVSNTLLQLLLMQIMTYGVFFCVFNLVPIPPLDGSKVIITFLPKKWQYELYRFEHYSQWILPILVFSGLFSRIAQPMTEALLRGMLDLSFRLL